MVNALTVDVEDYFHVSAFEGCIERKNWPDMPRRVKQNTEKVLDILSEFSFQATFFVLGLVAEEFPELVKRMAAEGHEIACHSYAHRRITRMSPGEFAEDIDRARKLLQDISGQEVRGFRAPSYSITQKSIWALDLLIEAGFSYDSSIFPICHDLYGIPDAPRHPHRIVREKGEIFEFPPTTLPFSLLGKQVNLPVSGGGYLRLLPVSCISAAFRRLNRNGRACMLYFHPWEIDPGQPRINAPVKSRFRHYLNLSRTEGKLRHLFERHRFAPMGTVLDSEVYADA